MNMATLESYGVLSSRIVTFNNSTRTIPPELVIPLKANTIYEFEYCLVYNQEYTYNANLNTFLLYTGELDFYYLTVQVIEVNLPGVLRSGNTWGHAGQSAAALNTHNFVGVNSLGGGLNANYRGSVLVRGQIRTTTAGDLCVEYIRSSNSNLGNNVWMCEGTYIMARPICAPSSPLVYSTQVFTSDGVWTPPSGLVSATVVAIGGGGGGGSGQIGYYFNTYNGGGMGGGGGGLSVQSFTAAQLPSAVDITIGQGGIGAPAFGPAAADTNGTKGGNGTASAFGALLTAGGGTGGSRGFTGASSNNVHGQGGSGTTSTGGWGGYVVIDTGATAYATGGSANGSAGKGPGGGGGGGGNRYSGGYLARNGGNGGNAPGDGIPTGGAGGTSSTSPTVGGQPSAAGPGEAGGGGGGGGAFTVNGGTPTGAGRNGGAGSGYGGGGGGGGCGVYTIGNPASAGGGGNGAPGCVYVIEYRR